MDFKIVQIPAPLFESTNVIRIGDTIIDTGHVDDASTSILLQQLESGDLRGVGEVIITHPHIDHVGASAGAPTVSEMPHILYRGAERVVENMSEYLWNSREEQKRLLPPVSEALLQTIEEIWDVYFPVQRKYHSINISKTVESGDVILAGDMILKVIHTPGHEPNHMALFHEASGTLFSGDLIANSAHFSAAPLTSNVGAYERSLERIIELSPKLIVPSHGTLIDSPMEHIETCVANLQNMKTKILNALEKLEEATNWEIIDDIFDVTDLAKRGTLALIVCYYLERLDEEGVISLDKDVQRARIARLS